MLPLFERARSLRLTETEAGILHWLEGNAPAAVHMNLSELCARLYTSSATVVRFCQKLGLSGYNDFKYQLREELRRSQEPVFSAGAYIDRSMARFKDTIAVLDIGKLERITDLFTSGRPLYIYGTNLSALPARYLQIVLNSLDYPSILIEWENLLSGLVQNMGGDAVLLVISARGRADYCLQALQTAKDRQITTVLLTGDPSSPLIPFSTVAVCTNDLEEQQGAIDVNSRLGFFTVIQILIEMTACKKQEP